ncbi:MAG TPA: YbhB/YbcL family Raf kinase inhibitor-like protein [Polyangia bacterium]|jgi:Raf kinase inhibitor-like YbhB/YbcL family protein|nr:YbhB/YbcL family Raf kinase inhibitor-like protein [Polyangia bacterium]
MRSSWKIGMLALVTAGSVAASLTAPKKVEAAGAFTMTSSAFKNNAAIPEKYSFNAMGCTGQNVSPPLEWKNPPAGTKSFALMVHDPDAPTGSGWWHWVVYNIPADATSLPEGATAATLPKGAVEGNTDFGKPGWGGPCPPPGSGKHHYQFMLYALKVDKIEVPPGATAAMVGFNAKANAIATAKLTGLFSRAK